MKRQFKRFSAMLLTAILAVSMAACGNTEQLSEAARQLSAVAESAVSEAVSEAASAVNEKVTGLAGSVEETTAAAENDNAAATKTTEAETDSTTEAESAAPDRDSISEKTTADQPKSETENQAADSSEEKTDEISTSGKAAQFGNNTASITDSDTESKNASDTAPDAGTAPDSDTAPESDTDEAAPADTSRSSVLDSLPEVGEVIHGFKVIDITDFKQKNARIVSMDHEQSGAELIYIACDDADKAFTVYYRTAADNDKGIPHIFEHITLSGSGKYPDATLWDQVATGTYNTYMNAATYQQMTAYIMSSLSDDQLLAIADFYMDGLTDPMALRDEHPLRREAYRFELEDPDGDITVTGAVFNEMEAANAALSSQSLHNALKLLYPGSIMSSNTGGFRNDIITVSLDELKTYYAKYYHPSNMLIAMYGDMEYERYLEMLDRDYLSKYEKRDITVSDDKYLPWTGEKHAVLHYPVTEDAAADGAGMVVYAVSLGDISVYDNALMNVISLMLSQESSPMVKTMEKEFPEAEFSVELYGELSEPVLLYTLYGSTEGDGERFREAVDSSIEEICESGLNKDIVTAIINRQEMSTILAEEEPGGLSVCESFALNWTRTGDRLAYLDNFRAIEDLEEEAANGTLDAMVSDYLDGPRQSILLEMNPDPGLQEAQDEAFAQLLADKKAGMGKTEIAELIGKTVEFRTWSALSGDDALFETIKNVSTDELPEEVVAAEIMDTAAGKDVSDPANVNRERSSYDSFITDKVTAVNGDLTTDESSRDDTTDAAAESNTTADETEAGEAAAAAGSEKTAGTPDIRRITSVIDNAPYLHSSLYLDAQTLDYDEIHDFVFLGEILGRMATEAHTADELDTALSTALYQYSIGPVIIYDDTTGEPHPYLGITGMELEDNIADAWKLLDEILTTTDFTDTDRLRYLASQAAAGMTLSLNENPSGYAVSAGVAAADPKRLYEYHATGPDYLAYLKKTADLSDWQAEQLGARLQATLAKLLNRGNAIYTAVGSEDTLREGEKRLDAFLEKLDTAETTPVDYREELDKLALPKSIAVTVNDSVNYNGYICANADSGLDNGGRAQVILQTLQNLLLYPAFRYDIGAYGFLSAIGTNCGYLLSYRDPAIAPSFEFLASVPERIAELEVTQGDVDDAITHVYSGLAYPQSPLDRALSEIDYALRGKSVSYAEELLQKMRDAKTVTPEDVTGSADDYEKFVENGVTVTAGNSAAISREAERYELVISDLTK